MIFCKFLKFLFFFVYVKLTKELNAFFVSVRVSAFCCFVCFFWRGGDGGIFCFWFEGGLFFMTIWLYTLQPSSGFIRLVVGNAQ